MLHVHCGDSSAESLRKSGVPGEVIVWSDPLIQGPVLRDLSDTEWYAKRSKAISESTRGALAATTVRERLKKQDAALARFREHEEVVLWFDACLFDQTILIRQLDWFSRQDLGRTKLSLLTLGEFPSLGRFKGLGELMPSQLASVMPERHEVTAGEFELAKEAWAAFCSPDPTNIEKFLEKDSSAIPYLAPALRRHIEQFPSVRNGLSRLENEILEVIDAGHMKLVEIFVWMDHKEEQPFFGDTFLWSFIDGLASAKSPLLYVDGPDRLPLWNPPKKLDPWSVFITETGCDVLAGKKDAIQLNGINRWLGGVHLRGREAQWRWDESGKKLVKTNARKADSAA